MARTIFKILLMVFMCFFFVTFIARDAIASYFTDETMLDEIYYSSLENEHHSNEQCNFSEESPMTPICNLIQAMYYIISTVWSLFMYFGCITWKIVSFNPCLSFMMGIAFTFLVLVKSPKSLSFMANKIFRTVGAEDQNKDNDRNEELPQGTTSAADDVSNVENEVVSQESSVEEELNYIDETGKSESQTEQHELSSVGTDEVDKNEDYTRKSVSSAGTKEEASHVTDVSRKKRRNSRNEKLMKDLLSIKELEEKLEKQITELYNELTGLKNEIEEIKANARIKDNEFDIHLENAVNQIRAQGNEFLKKSEDYTKVIEKLESDINTKITSSENLKQLFNGFPTEEDVVKWLHSSLCPLVEKDEGLYSSQEPRERRCFSIISRSPLAREVSCKFSDMIVTLDNN